jgi:hypothetical protein
VMVSRLLDLDDFLDPKSLTPQQLYKLQSDTWAQGAQAERERIINLLRSQVTKHHSILEMHIDQLESLIKGETK